MLCDCPSFARLSSQFHSWDKVNTFIWQVQAEISTVVQQQVVQLDKNSSEAKHIKIKLHLNV